MVREETSDGDGNALTASARCLVAGPDLTRRRDTEERKWAPALVEATERRVA